jgi:hypothetical protein
MTRGIAADAPSNEALPLSLWNHLHPPELSPAICAGRVSIRKERCLRRLASGVLFLSLASWRLSFLCCWTPASRESTRFLEEWARLFSFSTHEKTFVMFPPNGFRR